MPADMSRYPKDWQEISYYIRFVRGAGQCECTGECGLHSGRCDARHGQPHPVTGSLVILTTAHTLNKHDKMDVRPENLKGMCQRCHLIFDLDDHIKHARATRIRLYRERLAAGGQMELFE